MKKSSKLPLLSNTQWEWQQRLILEDSATQNEKTLPQDECGKLMHTQLCCPSKATSIWGNPNLSSLYEFSGKSLYAIDR